MGPSAGIFRPQIFLLQDSSCIQSWLYSSLFLGLQSLSSTSSCSSLNFTRLSPFWASVNPFFPVKRSSPSAGVGTSPLSSGLGGGCRGVAISGVLCTFPHSHISFQLHGRLLGCLLAGSGMLAMGLTWSLSWSLLSGCPCQGTSDREKNDKGVPATHTAIPFTWMLSPLLSKTKRQTITFNFLSNSCVEFQQYLFPSFSPAHSRYQTLSSVQSCCFGL